MKILKTAKFNLGLEPWWLAIVDHPHCGRSLVEIENKVTTVLMVKIKSDFHDLTVRDGDLYKNKPQNSGGSKRARVLSKFFQYHAVFGKFWQNRMLAPLLEGWRPHLGEILDPPLPTAWDEASTLSITLNISRIRKVSHARTAKIEAYCVNNG